ncbi:MAG TPA: YpdA family putative bacillithiol disulfide reductase [Thermoanaerobaculia bacterium]|nr:YpdA family putative bacillithiol disulfide reductase [Thermoanaerobaculia bacterium]
MPESVSPVVIAGAGPTGIACAIELGNRGIPAVCYDKGFLLHTLYHFPEEMRWYSTRDLLDIAGVPFAVPDAHPTRLESLAYYRGVAEKFQVKVVPHTEIFSIRPRAGGGLVVILSDSSSGASAKEEAKDLPSSVETEARELSAPAAIIATGFFHNPRRLNIPGEDLPHVHRRYISAYPFHDRDVVVLGSRNSAAEAALDLYRHGARVTLVARAPAISERVKYWIKPDLENRIRAGKIRALFQTRIQEIRRDAVLVEGPAGKQTFRADAVFPLIGYEPDFAFFERCGILLEGPNRIPSHDLETLESNVPNLYLAGAILGGTEVGRIFIENSRHHAALIANSIARRRLVPA